jgi:serine/threonine protein kinase
LLNSKLHGVYDVRIADFGFACFIDNLKRADDPDDEIICGTPGYIAPEALDGQGYTCKADIFSVGSILFNILTMKNLFHAKNYQGVMNKNLECNLSHIDYPLRKCSAEAKDLVKLLLIKDPSKRPTPMEALSHRWFSDELFPLKNSLNLNRQLAEKALQPRLFQIELQNVLCNPDCM